MLSLFGQLALYCAFAFSLMQGVLPLIGHYRHNRYLTAIARPAALGQCVFVLVAYILLTIAFVTSDFTIIYVAENSHPLLPFMYRLTAVWGAHEGSILLWIVMLNVWSIVYAQADKTSLRPLVLAVLGVISFSFLGFLLFTSNPFLVSETPLSGRDLNPLLQDFGFVIHPPMLYAGYVGFSVAFAITQGALLAKKLDVHWATITRRFALAAWCFLTLGIALGSWWAYRVLGWGGFWFWDPVENASLLPWLTGAALIHVLILVEKRDTAKGLAALLAIICFSLSLLGTFLVRSGLLVSAHTFANDPTRGMYLLMVLSVLLTAALAVYVSHIPPLIQHTKIRFARLSREMALLFNSGLLLLAMLTILLGTLYPLILSALGFGNISVGAPYFNLAMQPIILVIMIMMGFAVLCHYHQQTAKNLWQQSFRKFVFCFFAAGVIYYFLIDAFDFVTYLSLSLSLWIIVTAVSARKKLPAMALTHTGFAVFMIGIVMSSAMSLETQTRMKPGSLTKLGPYEFFFVKAEGVAGSNYKGIRATFDVSKGSRHITSLFPEKRIYVVREMVMTTVDIHPGIFRDLYIALGEPLEGDDWSVRIYYKPFIRWIWAGGIMMLLGGILAILRRRAN